MARNVDHMGTEQQAHRARGETLDRVTRPAPIVVRDAVALDGDSVWPLTRTFATSFATSRAAFDHAFDTLRADTNSLVLVAETPAAGTVGYLVGSSHMTLFANGPVAWVEELMVAEAVRGRGIGRQLMAQAEAWASARGAGYLALATRRAGQFYEALDYENSAVFFRKMLDGRDL